MLFSIKLPNSCRLLRETLVDFANQILIKLWRIFRTILIFNEKLMSLFKAWNKKNEWLKFASVAFIQFTYFFLLAVLTYLFESNFILWRFAKIILLISDLGGNMLKIKVKSYCKTNKNVLMYMKKKIENIWCHEAASVK